MCTIGVHHPRMSTASTASPAHDVKIRSIPVELWKAVHVAVRDRNTTIRQFVIDALTAHLQRETTT